MNERFRLFAASVSAALGSPMAFCALVVILAFWFGWYARSGWAETINLIGNVSISVFTLLLGLVILSTQNRESDVTQTKLDALIDASDAENRFVGLQDYADDDLKAAVEWLRERREAL